MSNISKIQLLVVWSFLLSFSSYSCQSKKNGKFDCKTTDSLEIVVDSTITKKDICLGVIPPFRDMLSNMIEEERGTGAGPLQHIGSFQNRHFEFMCNPIGDPEVQIDGDRVYVEVISGLPNPVSVEQINWSDTSLLLSYSGQDEKKVNGSWEKYEYQGYHYVVLIADTLNHFIFKDFNSTENLLELNHWLPIALRLILPLDGSNKVIIEYNKNRCIGFVIRTKLVK
ncbi:MAG: hypothetical protein H6581_14745 [Bacteroidia bacterium]|nr:hypothetical protein [Bacteroidia bacterium]